MSVSDRRSSPLEEDDDLYSGTPAPRSRLRAGRTSTSASPSPTVSMSSDKENRTSSRPARRNPGKPTAMPPPAAVTNSSTVSGRPGKRRRLTDRDETPLASQIAHERELEEMVDSKYYDPDQDINERRAIRKGLRDLNRDLNDSRAEYLAPNSTGIADTLHKANEYFDNVKQTSDATLDSRLLVSAADLSYKKTAQLTLGDGSHSLDVDDFVSKCIRFMRRGPGPRSDGTLHPSSSPHASRHHHPHPRRRAHRSSSPASSDHSIDETDVLDWEFFGRRACYPTSLRPPTPGFLLGPLSVLKRARAPTQRTARARRDPNDVIQPEELQLADLEKVENSNLTVLCTRIRASLLAVQHAGEAAVQAAADARAADDQMSAAEVRALMDAHRIADDSGVQLYPFIVHPTSFGQTVENLFYVSFLIRDGSAGVGEDSDGLPTLHATTPRKIAEIKELGVMKHQAIFSLDHQTWREIVRAFGLTEPMIPDREGDAVVGMREEGDAVVGNGRGWYG